VEIVRPLVPLRAVAVLPLRALAVVPLRVHRLLAAVHRLLAAVHRLQEAALAAAVELLLSSPLC
jgi:hypothetical protein